jgi:aminoglycoside phosphotransferase (APT) family kinase protein
VLSMISPVLAQLVERINAAHGTRFALGERFASGEQGAYALVEPDGRRCVLKWRPGEEVAPGVAAAATATARLRALGYPAPRYRFLGTAPSLGCAYSVQEALVGAPLGDRLDGAVLDDVLRLNALQRGRAEPASDWPDCLARMTLEGGPGFALIDPMRTHSAETADLLSTLQATARAGAGTPAPTCDVVHFDFQGGNVLVDSDRVTGVVDWEGVRAGDCAFDLAIFFFYQDGRRRGGADPAAQERLWRALAATTPPPLLSLYVAHAIHRQVDWSIRFPRPGLLEWSLRRSREVLRRLAWT